MAFDPGVLLSGPSCNPGTALPAWPGADSSFVSVTCDNGAKFSSLMKAGVNSSIRMTGDVSTDVWENDSLTLAWPREIIFLRGE
ncbi:hypothetical protein V1264_006987 [Littorina saxatilis]|uniref:Uncharacterized protein n=1 Tax=Littorina saxatilis TaxID=31220 RepID=A0AAN9ATW0_9CAEN